MPTQSELEAQQQQIEAERLALEAEQAQIERDYQAAEANRREAEKAAQAESTYFTPFADRPDAVAEDLTRRKELEYNTRLEDTQKRYEQARAGYEQRVAKFQERASIFESGREGFNKNVDVYNIRQKVIIDEFNTPQEIIPPKKEGMFYIPEYGQGDRFLSQRQIAEKYKSELPESIFTELIDVATKNEQVKADYELAVAKQSIFSDFLGKVAEGKESVEDINISISDWGYSSSQSRKDARYSEASGWYWKLAPQEEKEREAVAQTKSYLGLGAEDIIRVNGKVVQESIFDPDEIKIAGDVFSERQAALSRYKRERELEQDRLKSGWSASFKDDATLKAVQAQGYAFGTVDAAKLQGLLKISSLWNMDAKKTDALLAANLKGSYAKEAREGMQYTVGGVTFSKPDIADQYSKQLSGLDFHPDNFVAPSPGEYGYHATPSNPAGLFQSSKEMPKDINPVTGKGWAERENPLQKYEDAEKEYNRLTPSAQLSGGVAGGLLSWDMFSATYQALLENSPTAKRTSDLLKRGINKAGLRTTSSLVFGGESVIPFELESAKMGDTTITYEKTKEPTPKQKFALAFKTTIEKNFPDYEKGYTPYQAVKTGLTAAAKSANLFADDSGVLGITIGAVGIGGGIGAASRTKVLGRPLIGATGMKTIGYGATAITGISAVGKTAEGQYGSAASDVAMFAIGVPAVVAGYQGVMAIKMPVIEGGYRRALFGSTGFKKGGVSKQYVSGKTVTRTDIVANIRKDNPVLQKMFGKSKTSPNYQLGKTVTRSELIKTVQRGRTDTQKLFGVRRSEPIYEDKILPQDVATEKRLLQKYVSEGRTKELTEAELSSIVAPVFKKMGIKTNRFNIALAPKGFMSSGLHGVAEKSTGGIILRKRKAIIEIINVLGHEAGHIVAKGGSDTGKNTLSRWNPKRSFPTIRAEATAYRFQKKFANAFKDIYGVDISQKPTLPLKTPKKTVSKKIKNQIEYIKEDPEHFIAEKISPLKSVVVEPQYKLQSVTHIKAISKNELIRSLKRTATEKPSKYTGWQEETPKYIERSETVLVAETRPSTKSWYHFRPAKGKVIAKKNIISNKPAGKTMRTESTLPANWKEAPLGRSTGDVAVGSGRQMLVLKTRQQAKQATKTVLSAKKVVIREKVASDYVQEYAKQKTMPKVISGKFKGFVLINPVEDVTTTEYDYSTTYPQRQSNIIGLRQNTAIGVKSKVGMAVSNLNIMGVKTDTSQLSKQMQSQFQTQKSLQRQQQKQISLQKQKQVQFQRQESLQKQMQKQVQGLKQISVQRQKQTTKQKLTSRLLKDVVTRQKPKGASRIIAKGGTIKLPSGSGKSIFGTRKTKSKSFSFMEYTPVAMPKSKSGKRSIWK